MFNATLPNNLTWSISSSKGTIFIQSICQVFNEAYKNLPNNLPMSQMITKIKQKVKEQKRQSAETRSVLTKEIYFSPKDVSLIFEGILNFSIF